MGLNKYFYKAKTDPRYNDIYGGQKWVIGSLIIKECMSNPIYVHSPDECDCDIYQIRQTESTFADWNMPFEYNDYYIDKNTTIIDSYDDIKMLITIIRDVANDKFNGISPECIVSILYNS